MQYSRFQSLEELIQPDIIAFTMDHAWSSGIAKGRLEYVVKASCRPGWVGIEKIAGITDESKT
jgi:hypothetical protein